MKRQTLVLKAPKSFIDRVLWPEFQQINVALSEYLSEVTDKVIREEVFGQAGQAGEAEEELNRRSFAALALFVRRAVVPIEEERSEGPMRG